MPRFVTFFAPRIYAIFSNIKFIYIFFIFAFTAFFQSFSNYRVEPIKTQPDNCIRN